MKEQLKKWFRENRGIDDLDLTGVTDEEVSRVFEKAHTEIAVINARIHKHAS